MVHALNEIRRTLASDGLLIDLRPLLDRWPVEVSWTGGYREAGRATDLAEPRADDAAANAAMAQGPQRGGFLKEREDSFPFFYYWDTPKEMEEELLEDWDDVIQIEQPVWDDLKRAWASANAEARVRLRVKMLRSRRYQRRDVPVSGSD